MALMQLIVGKNSKKGFCLPGKKGGTDNISLEMDVILSETPNYSATPTKSQVESGADITDHIALDPVSLTIEGIVSNTPVGLDKILTGQQFKNRSEAAHQFLLNLRNSREPFDFVGSLGVYENMVITKYSPVRDSKNGKALVFTATLDAITIVETSMVASTNSSDDVKHGTAGTENSGHQATKSASDKNKTIAASLVDKFGSGTIFNGLVRP